MRTSVTKRTGTCGSIERFNSEERNWSLTSANKCSWEGRSDRITSTIQHPTDELHTIQLPTEELRTMQEHTLTSYDTIDTTICLSKHISTVRMGY